MRRAALHRMVAPGVSAVTLLDVLSTSPQTKRELAAKLGCETREVEALVQSYRVDGAAILSDGDGYRLGASAAEVDACAQRLRRRAIHQLVTARALRATARRWRAREAEPLAFRWDVAS